MGYQNFFAFRLKKKVFGLGFYVLRTKLKNFGFSTSWRSGVSCSNSPKGAFGFVLRKVENELIEHVALNFGDFNSGLKKSLLKRIRILKINRTLRGLRHVQFLPVRHQRTKTNAKTQKRKRK